MEKTADILWKSCANGNNESFKSLFDTWYEPLCRYSCFFTGDSMDAEEVVLDFFMYIWHNRATIVIEKSFEAYAKSAVHNRSLNKIRSRKHHEELDKASSVSFEETYEFDTDTLIDVAWEAASSAPKRCREIFNMSRKDGLTYAQIASRTGLDVKTVEGYMTRALKYMRIAIKKIHLFLIFV